MCNYRYRITLESTDEDGYIAKTVREYDYFPIALGSALTGHTISCPLEVLANVICSGMIHEANSDPSSDELHKAAANYVDAWERIRRPIREAAERLRQKRGDS